MLIFTTEIGITCTRAKFSTDVWLHARENPSTHPIHVEYNLSWGADIWKSQNQNDPPKKTPLQFRGSTFWDDIFAQVHLPWFWYLWLPPFSLRQAVGHQTLDQTKQTFQRWK